MIVYYGKYSHQTMGCTSTILQYLIITIFTCKKVGLGTKLCACDFTIFHKNCYKIMYKWRSTITYNHNNYELKSTVALIRVR